MSNNRLIEIITGVFFIGGIILLIRELNKVAETKLYDNRALDELENSDKRKQLDAYINKYHEEGVWDKKLLEKTK